MNSQETKDVFYQELKLNPKVTQTPSGLFYEVLEPGSKPLPTEKSKVTVHYEGRLIDGTVFDSTAKHGKPAQFALQGVIPGFREGLQLIGAQGKIRLFIPPHLGYGDQALSAIPAGSILIFDIDLLSID